ncbi:uncharacterized protein LOC127583857, partial [Pristis pectinata]|uniref:uncharacterized protein LOC127583857 n=1 Tax=Pristis pectinata TaxID=685728 RepID=UPI00223CA9CD
MSKDGRVFCVQIGSTDFIHGVMGVIQKDNAWSKGIEHMVGIIDDPTTVPEVPALQFVHGKMLQWLFNSTTRSFFNCGWVLQTENGSRGIHSHLVVERMEGHQSARLQKMFKQFTESDQGKCFENRTLDCHMYRHANGRIFQRSVDGGQFVRNYLRQKVPGVTPRSNGRKTYYAVRAFRWTAFENEIQSGLWKQIEVPDIVEAEPFDNSTCGEVGEALCKSAEKLRDLVEYCTDRDILTKEQLMYHAPDRYLNICCMNQGTLKLRTIMEMVQTTSVQKGMDQLIRRNAKSSATLAWFCRQEDICKHYLATLFYRVLCKKNGKRNWIALYGPPGTGKSMIMNALVDPRICFGSINLHNENFPFNDCQNKHVILCDELVLNHKWIEQFKTLTSGVPFRCDRKCNDSVLIGQTPVISTSNTHPHLVQYPQGLSSKHKSELSVRCNIVHLKSPWVYDEVTFEDLCAFMLDYNCDLELPQVITKAVRCDYCGVSRIAQLTPYDTIRESGDREDEQPAKRQRKENHTDDAD